MGKTWKVAVVGCGCFANSQYLPNITKEANAVLTATCDIVPERAEAAAKKYGTAECKAFPNVYEMIEKGDFDITIDAASIQAHNEINMAVLKAGKHLISQKPAAPTVEELTVQIELAKKMGVKFVCVPIHPMRYDLAVGKRLMNSGAIGEPTYIKCNLAHGGPEYFQFRNADPSWFFEKDAGALVDMGVHGLQIVTYMFGPVKKVSCLAAVTDAHRVVRSGSFNGKVLDSGKLPDEYLISLTFASGKIGFVDSGFAQKASKQPQLEIYGTRGTLSFTKPYMTNPMPEVFIDNSEMQLRGWVEPSKWEVEAPKLNSQCCCLKDLIHAIENNCEPALRPEHARHILEIMCKIPKAIETGAAVELETSF